MRNLHNAQTLHCIPLLPFIQGLPYWVYAVNFANMHQAVSLADQKPLSDVWMLTVAAPVPAAVPKEPKNHKKRDSAGLKMITSYNLFCEHRRPEVRAVNPEIVPRSDTAVAMFLSSDGAAPVILSEVCTSSTVP